MTATSNLLTSSPRGVSTQQGPWALNVALRDSYHLLSSTNLHFTPTNFTRRGLQPGALAQLQTQLEIARRQRLAKQFEQAEPTLIRLLNTDSTEEIQRTALVELALLAQEQNQLGRAQQIFSQYLARWPEDPSTPEILLRQGLLFRQMGLNNLALTKFYAVMTSALVLKTEHLEYYQRLVLQAQTEIAETQFQNGKFTDAAEFFARLLRFEHPGLNKPQLQFKLVRCLANLRKPDEVVVQAQDFLSRHDRPVEEPEIRFMLAVALKQLGRNGESLQQVLALLRDEKQAARQYPETWSYWQQRSGNEIANQLYLEGDYVKALELYLSLADLDRSPQWQVPAWYQIAMVYEKLEHPAKAKEAYERILAREPDVKQVNSPGLTAILDMARWRRQFLAWQDQAESANRELKQSAAAGSGPPGLERVLAAP